MTCGFGGGYSCKELCTSLQNTALCLWLIDRVEVMSISGQTARVVMMIGAFWINITFIDMAWSNPPAPPKQVIINHPSGPKIPTPSGTGSNSSPASSIDTNKKNKGLGSGSSAPSASDLGSRRVKTEIRDGNKGPGGGTGAGIVGAGPGSGVSN